MHDVYILPFAKPKQPMTHQINSIDLIKDAEEHVSTLNTFFRKVPVGATNTHSQFEL